MSFMYGEAYDYNDFVAQVRGFLQGHPQVLLTNDKLPQSGFRITGSGLGDFFVSTEAYTPAGNPGSPSGSPLPGTTYRLTCTVAGNEATSPRAQFTVEQLGVSPSVIGTLTAGEKFFPDSDDPQFIGSPLGSPGLLESPQHGLRINMTTTVDWVVSDTIEFTLVDHFLGRNSDDNYIEQRWTLTDEDGNGNYRTEWIARMPTIASAGGSPEAQVYAGLQTSFSVGSNYYNVAIMGADGFEPSSLFNAQPNTSGVRYAFLDDNSFPFWIAANADGFWAAARPGSIYQHMTAQLLDVFATGNQHPKPLYIGAMSEFGTLNFSEIDNDRHSAPFDPGNEASGRFRWTDASWYDVVNRANNYLKSVVPTRYFIPYKGEDSVSNYDNGTFDGVSAEKPMTTDRASNQFTTRYDGSLELIPITLIITDPQVATVGDLKFVKYVPGRGINAEDTTTDTSESPNKEYIALSQANLTDRDNFVVMELVE